MRRSPSPLPPSSNFLTTTLSTPFTGKFVLASLIACVLAIASPLLLAQTTPALVTQPVDNSVRTILPGNVHPLARAEFDQGEAPSDLALNRMLLVLKRSAQQETALRRLIENQQNKKSSSYLQWLTPEQFGAQYGPAESDVAAVTNWLQQSGFQITAISNGRTMIEFSGTAGQVKQAFGTAIHQYVIKGESHWANASNPSIPTALASVVAGVHKLHSFRKKAQNIQVGKYSEKTKQLTTRSPNFDTVIQGSDFFAVSPFDFATIYDLLPLWNAGTTGAGQTIAIVGDSDIYQGDSTSNPPILSDAATFWTLFGLGANGVPMPTLKVTYNGPNPGFNGDESEADIDTQWAGSVAPGATINYIASQDTETDDGVDLSALYIIDNNVAPVMSESFGACEAGLTSEGVQFYQLLWEQAAAQGITVMVSTGDSGSAGCDSPDTENVAQFGLGVNGIASTAFNVAVGGTDFNQFNKQSTYWNSTNNPNTQQSVMTGIYIPETTWNDSCTNLLLQFLPGGTTNPEANCNNSQLQPDFLDIAAGSGGASGEVNLGFGTMKPTWQTGTPADNARDLPDVSLFASNGFVGSLYVFCESDLNTPQGCALTDLQGAGGTSFSSPAFAGIMALVNQQYGPQGIANLVLYNLSSKQPNAFHDVPAGSTISVPCVTSTQANPDPNCTTNTAGDAYGVLTTPSSSTVEAWNTTTGYDLATGLGSVDAANLVNNWKKVTFTGTNVNLTLPTATITHGAQVTVTVSAAPTSGPGTPTGDVALLVNPKPGTPAIDWNTLKNGTITWQTTLLPGGTYEVIAHYEGDTTFGGNYSLPSGSITVNPENSFVYMPGLDIGTDQNGNIVYVSTVPYGSPYLLRADVLNSQQNFCLPPAAALNFRPFIACPTGTMTFTDNGNPLDGGTFTLNSLGYTEDQQIQLTAGNHVLAGSYGGDPSYNSSSSGNVNVTVTQAATNATVAAPGTATTGVPFTVSATVATSSSGVAPTGTVTFYANGTALPGQPAAVVYTPVNGSASGSASLGASLSTTIGTAGSYAITATYSGDTNYTGTTSTNSATITVQAPGFTLSAAPSTLSVAQGGMGTSTITVNPTGGFTGSVTLAASGLPSGVTAAFGTNPTTGTSLLTLTASSSATAGTATVTISGTSGNLTGMTTIALTVAQGPIVPATLTAPPAANPGQSTSTTMMVSPGGGGTFSSNVTYACSGLPTGATCSFSPTQITSGSSATNVTVTVNTAGPFTGSAGSAQPSNVRPNNVRPNNVLPNNVRPSTVRPKQRSQNQRLWLPLGLPLASIVLVGLFGQRLPLGYKIFGLCLALALAGFLVACGGGSSGPPPVTVTPSSAQVQLGATQQFTASATVTWSLSAFAVGTISSSGLYTAPTTGTTPASLTVTATPTTGTAGTAAITIPAIGVTVSPSTVSTLYPSLSGAPAQTQQFMATVTGDSNDQNVTWAVTGGILNGTIDQTGLYTAPASLPNPAGVTVTATSQADSTKSGSATVNLQTPTAAGTYPVTVTVTEGSIQETTTFSLTVN